MKKFIGFERGMGIGGWLTNFKRLQLIPKNRHFDLTVGDFEHFFEYITESDIKYIAELGMDHIRLGFDQIVLEEKPFCYRESTFGIIDSFIGWCEKYGLNIVLNLHKAVGNYCDITSETALTDNEALRERFTALWVEFEKRYSAKSEIAFELLNEVCNIPPEKWNGLAEKTICAIRKLNKTRKIIIGPVCWNNPPMLPYLQLFDDENVIYTFHMYEPQCFTHQQGVLRPDMLYYNRKMPYPCDIERYRDFEAVQNGNFSAYPEYEKMDITYIRNYLRPAVDFIKNNPDKILWCGEFGTIRHANIKWRENWMRDVITVLRENGIPYCVWNYLSTPNDGNRFSLVDDDSRKILSENMHNIICGKV